LAPLGASPRSRKLTTRAFSAGWVMFSTDGLTQNGQRTLVSRDRLGTPVAEVFSSIEERLSELEKRHGLLLIQGRKSQIPKEYSHLPQPSFLRVLGSIPRGSPFSRKGVAGFSTQQKVCWVAAGCVSSNRSRWVQHSTPSGNHSLTSISIVLATALTETLTF